VRPLDAVAGALVAVGRPDLTESHPDTHAGWSVSVEPFRNDFLSDNTKRGLWLLLGAVVFVLLISCANVATLLLARGTARERQLAVRTALGASRTEVVRQLITESLVLAFVGGALGVALAYALLRVVVALIPPDMLPTEADIRLNVPVLLFTLAACALSGVLSVARRHGRRPARASIPSSSRGGRRSAVPGTSCVRGWWCWSSRSRSPC
jgi:hypothetical protein